MLGYCPECPSWKSEGERGRRSANATLSLIQAIQAMSDFAVQSSSNFGGEVLRGSAVLARYEVCRLVPPHGRSERDLGSNEKVRQ